MSMGKPSQLSNKEAYADARGQAGQHILDLIDQVRVRPGKPEMSPEEVDQMVDEEVKAVRRTRQNRQRRGYELQRP